METALIMVLSIGVPAAGIALVLLLVKLLDRLDD